MRLFAILLYLVPIALYASKIPQCVSFGFLAEDGGEKLILPTYDRLLDTVSGKLTDATLGKMLAAKDPFAIPETAGEDFQTLNQHLKAFREMLKQREWNGDTLRADLLAAVARRRSGAQSAETSRERAVARQSRALHIPRLNTGSTRASSPDGDWFVVSHVPHSPLGPVDDWVVTVHNRHTGESKQYPGPRGGFGEATFSGDGKHLWFARDGYRITEVPFENGIIDWAKAKLVGKEVKEEGHPEENKALTHLEQLRHGGDPRFIYGVNNMHGRTIFRLNRATNERSHLYLGKLFGPSDVVHDWEVSPNDEIVFQIKNETTETVRSAAYKMDPNGDMTPVPGKDLKSRPGKIPQTKFVTGGRGGGQVWYLDQDTITRLDPVSGKKEKIVDLPRRPLPTVTFVPDRVIPRGDGLAMVYQERAGISFGKLPSTYIEFWDPRTGYSGMKELPEGSSSEVELTGDGDAVIVGFAFKKEIQIIPVDRLLGDSP